MSININERTDDRVEDDLFSQGWLDRHIDIVVAEIATRPLALRPHLIGARARAMRQIDWDADH